MPIVVRALDLMGQYGTPVETGATHAEALYEAAKHNSSDIIKLLLDRSIHLEREGLSKAFDVACEFGHSRAVSSLVENYRRNIFGPIKCSKSMVKAAMKGHSELVLFLIQRYSGQKYLTISEEAVKTVSSHGFADILRLLVEKFLSSESRHNILNRALNIATRNDHTEVAEFLIREGGDVNAVVERVSTPQDGFRSL